MKTAAQIGVTAVTTAATAIGALTKASIENYAEYEQLVGGIDTLFKKQSLDEFIAKNKDLGLSVQDLRKEYEGMMQDADKVVANAQNAYMSAGLSANEYMQTVTSFSASLISSLGNDTSAAVEYADMAIVDMADNANKMGTSMEMIQNAYQGFAKQNYTMLDNLKLGYGGTQKEMKRLLKDADALSESFNLMTDENGDLVYSFADIVEAIHIVQDEMGISGATAEEASETIQGSVAAMKASWTNLLTGMSDKTADMDKLIKNFVVSVGTVGKNVLPKVKTALEGAGELVEEIFPEIMAMIPELIDETLPDLLDSAISIIETLVNGLAENGEQLGQSAVDLVTKLATGLIDNLPQVIDAGMQILLGIVQGLADNTPTLLDKVMALIPQIVSSLTSPDSLGQIINSAIEIIGALIEGLGDAVPQLLTAALDIVIALCEYLLVPENIATIVVTMAEFVLEIGKALVAGVGGLLVSVIEFGAELIAMFKDIDWASIGSDLVEKIKTGISNAWETFVSWVQTKASEILSKFSNTDWKSIGSDIVAGIKSGISNAWSLFTSWVKEKAQSIVSSVESILGIASPSKVFARIGRFMVEGLGVGWNDEIDSVTEDITSSLDFSSYKIPTLTASVSTVNSTGQSGASLLGGVTIIQNIYAQEMTAAELMQEAKYRAQQAVIFGV